MDIYLVGGAVRDKLLGLPVKDLDYVVVGATEQQMLELGYQQVGRDFPVFLHPQTGQEYALARTERKTGKGYGGFSCYASPEVTLEQDLQRRDLTINAMAMDEQGNIIDPYHGQQDLEQKCLRHVSEAFAEDPLRVLRVARFSARFHHLGFHIATPTLALMTELCTSEEMQALSAERVWQETERALGEASPEVYFETLQHTGGLNYWFAELACLWGIPNPEKWHPEIDTGVHTMMALQQAVILSEQVTVRFATLCHDIGKGLTDPANWPSHRGHETTGLTAINQLADRIKAPNNCRELALMASEFHTHIHQALQLKASTLLKVFNRCDAWRRPERFALFLLVCEADARGRKGLQQQPYPQADYVRQAWHAAQQINVQDIIAKGYQGAEIGEQLQQQRLKAIKELRRSAD